MATPVHLSSLVEHLTVRNVLCLACTVAIVKYRDNLLWVVNSWRSPLRHLAGPKNENLILGNLMSLVKAQNSTVWEEWVEKYGKTLRYRGFFGSYQLATLDMRAVNFVLSHSTTFPKSERNRKSLARALGAGLLSADLDAHKRQRRIMVSCELLQREIHMFILGPWRIRPLGNPKSEL
ncbi:hypothetical protein FS749_007831 [Ceratobasidium sp. UAMH 11750]|nr:hypothetical protein FS749_007831 [Ceratobasidium sp. UAMH 11750]